MASLKERVTGRVDRLRERFAWFDHAVRTVRHYGTVNGDGQAGAVTYFGFLSVFPILALSFFVVGLLAHLYPDIRPTMVREIGTLLPGVIGEGKGQIPVETIESSAGGAASLLGVLGLLGLLILAFGGAVEPRKGVR